MYLNIIKADYGLHFKDSSVGIKTESTAVSSAFYMLSGGQ